MWAFLAHASGTGALLGGVREDVGYATLFDELGVGALNGAGSAGADG